MNYSVKCLLCLSVELIITFVKDIPNNKHAQFELKGKEMEETKMKCEFCKKEAKDKELITDVENNEMAIHKVCLQKVKFLAKLKWIDYNSV